MKAAIKRFPDRYFLVYFRPYYISYVMSKNVSLVVCHNTLLQKKVIWQIQRKYKLKIFNNFGVIPGGGGTPLQDGNRDVPLDGVAFSRLE